MNRILLFSGPAGVGKTSIVEILVNFHEYKPLKSSKYLREIADRKKLPVTRENLQNIGDDLDRRTNFQWIVDNVAIPQISGNPDHNHWLLDSVRKNEQVANFRENSDWNIFHVYITAPERIIIDRFEKRKLSDNSNQYEKSYEELINHPNEISSRWLEKIADFVLHYEQMTPKQAANIIKKNWLK